MFPLIGGIVAADYLFFAGVKLSIACLLVAGALVLPVLILLYYFNRRAPRWLFWFFANAFFLVVGLGLTTSGLNRTHYSFPDKDAAYRVVITSHADVRERSVRCTADVISGYDSLSFPVGREVLLYFPPDSASAALKRGDEILFYGRLALPTNNGNPDEFDYPRYLLRKGVSASGFVPAGRWQPVSRSAATTWREVALHCRDSILNYYRSLGFTDEEFGILSALTVGYKEELGEEIRESFSVSGVSHVLALSGLHVGIIFGILFLLLRGVMGNSRWAVVLRVLIIMLFLWTFAFVTGLSASVVRAVLMCSLTLLASIRSGSVLTVQSLSTAALLMLLYAPCWLFDVGFQLSFIAVLGIAMFQPGLHGVWPVTNPVLKYFWGIITVSVSAQVAVAPLVVFYFSRFSTHFLLTNILVVQVVSFIIYGAVCLLLLSPFAWLQQLLVAVVQLLIRWMLLAVRWVEQLPFASIDGLWLGPWEVLLLYVFVLSVAGLLSGWRIGRVWVPLGCLCLLAGSHAWRRIDSARDATIAFYNVRQVPAVHCIHATTGQSWMVFADSIPNYGRLHKALAPYRNRRRLSPTVPVTGDYRCENLVRTNNILSFMGKRVAILNDDLWMNKRSDTPLYVDYLYVCNGYKRSMTQARELFNFRLVVLDASLPAYRREAVENECARMGIGCTSLSAGALLTD